MEVNGSTQFSVDGLRPIFDLLPRDLNDRVKITDFVDLLRDHINVNDSQMLESMVQKFDTDNNGCVTFSEFCAGVQNMSNDNFLTLLAKPIDIGSQEGDECNSRVPSDGSTFNEYDIFTDDDQVDPGNAAPLFNDTFATSLNDSKTNPFHEEYVNDLQEKMVMLEKEIEHLTNSHRDSDETTSRVKEENTALIQRVHTLEDMLEDLDLQSRQRLEEETTRRQQTLRRLEKERSSEVDLLTDRLQQLEKDYSQLSEELPILRADNKRLAAEVTVKQHELSAVQADYEVLLETNTRLKSELDTSRHDTAVQLSVKQQLIEELTRELDDVRHHHGDSQSERSVRRHELEQQLVRLKEENAYLREHTEDLEDQLNCMSSGQSMWINGVVNQSLAQEIDGMGKDELITALKEQQCLSESLRDYIDMLTARVLEVNPTLLEVHTGNNRKR